VSVRDNCKHYILQSVSVGDKLERCRLAMNKEIPFSCPEDCIFFEQKTGISKVGWHVPNQKSKKRPNPPN
jgi:predicted ABC-class ATPase